MNKTDFKTLIVILVVLLIFSIIVLILYNVTEKEKSAALELIEEAKKYNIHDTGEKR